MLVNTHAKSIIHNSKSADRKLIVQCSGCQYCLVKFCRQTCRLTSTQGTELSKGTEEQDTELREQGKSTDDETRDRSEHNNQHSQ